MPRFFVGADQLVDGTASVLGQDAEHLARSLRAQIGQLVVVVDESGVEHGVRLKKITPQHVSGTIDWSRPVTGEPRLQVHVLHAIAKDGMDEAVDAMAAIGAASIRPCITERTIVRPDRVRQARRVQHWHAIAQQAAQLSGRGRVPRVHPVQTLAEAVTAFPDGARVLACVVTEKTTALSRFNWDGDDTPIVLCIGPEGDFGPRDVALLERAGARGVHLGPRVLRSRLAGAFALSLLLATARDLDRPVEGAPDGEPLL